MRAITRAGAALSGHAEVTAVLLAAVLGLTVQGPLTWLDRHDGIDIALVCLVVASGLTIAPAGWRRIGSAWPALAAALLAGITVLPALAWLVGRLVAAGPLRNGLLTVGLAPCEIASVATTTMAGGDTALAAGMLVGSTILTAALAGPLLSLEAGGATVPTGHIVVTLCLVVVMPLAAAVALRAASPRTARAEAPAGTVATAAVAVLVALVAAQVHLSGGYAALALALALFVALTAVLGWALGRTGHPDQAVGLFLTVSMRDFAVAAGLATAAFGAAAAAPLGLYGIMVLGWGTLTASRRRAKARPRNPELPYQPPRR